MDDSLKNLRLYAKLCDFDKTYIVISSSGLAYETSLLREAAITVDLCENTLFDYFLNVSGHVISHLDLDIKKVTDKKALATMMLD